MRWLYITSQTTCNIIDGVFVFAVYLWWLCDVGVIKS